MIKYLLCWIFGHKFVQQIHVGKTVKYFLGDAYDSNKYVSEQAAFCLRCSKPNPYYEK